MSLPVRKLFLIPVFSLFLLSGLTAQTLFTLDGAGVGREEYLKAYNKNNTGEKPTEKSYREYLELYIRYKLKVRAAYEAQLDTLPAQRAELQNFRSQVAETYLKDETSLDRLIREAYNRGQKDIRLAHILIALPKNPTPADTLKAYDKAMEAYNSLKRGKKFGETALAYSEDPSVKSNAGSIGYITVFTLPYELENLAYSTPAGQFSKPYRSKGGYHIFKNEGERKAFGRVKVAQILLAYPPGATESTQATVRLKADSIYLLLAKGGDFAALARSNSGDNLTYQTGGELPEFGVGRYDSAFEAAVYALGKEGAISRPLPSVYGYHILKLIGRKPFPATYNEETAALLKQEIQNDPRIETSRRALLDKILRQTDFRRADLPWSDLWAFTDSVQRNIGLSSYHGLTYTTTVFSFAQRSYSVKEWLDFTRAVRAQRAGGAQAGKELFERYIDRTALDYYRAHLEEYNKDFAFQLTEFKEGNLLFEIMQRKIWDKASTDSAGLRDYYEAHKDKYWWESSADAMLFTCNSQKTADLLKSRLSLYSPSGWRSGTDSAGASIQADSGRYELVQIPGADKTGVSAGTFTSFVSNKADNTVSFAYIQQVYQRRSPRNYRDARGFVINDYQNWLEEQWIMTLKKKYPVKIEETVFAGLPK
jgi:peptidyl-prolyl cis-trans isomerase SurA